MRPTVITSDRMLGSGERVGAWQQRWSVTGRAVQRIGWGVCVVAACAMPRAEFADAQTIAPPSMSIGTTLAPPTALAAPVAPPVAAAAQPNLWSFLGVPQIAKGSFRVGRFAVGKVRRLLPFGQPLAPMGGGLGGPAGPGGMGPAGPGGAAGGGPKPVAAQAVANKQKADAVAEVTAEALAFLAEDGCTEVNPDTATTILEALSSPSAKVREQAVRVVWQTASKCQGGCALGSCCSGDILRKLERLGYGYSDDGLCRLEPDPTVRRLARRALGACQCCGATSDTEELPETPPLDASSGGGQIDDKGPSAGAAAANPSVPPMPSTESPTTTAPPTTTPPPTNSPTAPASTGFVQTVSYRSATADRGPVLARIRLTPIYAADVQTRVEKRLASLSASEREAARATIFYEEFQSAVNQTLVLQELATDPVGVSLRLSDPHSAQWEPAQAVAKFLEAKVPPVTSIAPAEIEQAYIARRAEFRTPAAVLVEVAASPFQRQPAGNGPASSDTARRSPWPTRARSADAVDSPPVGAAHGPAQQAEATLQRFVELVRNDPAARLPAELPARIITERPVWKTATELQAMGIWPALAQLRPHEFSPILVDRDAARVYRVLQRKPESVLPLSQVRDQIVADLQRERRATQTRDYLQALRQLAFQDRMATWDATGILIPTTEPTAKVE